MTTFWYSMLDVGNCPINPSTLEVEATCLGHAMQKIAHALADDCVEVRVWMGHTQTARIKAAKRRDIAAQVKTLGADSLLPPGYRPRRKGAKK